MASCVIEEILPEDDPTRFDDQLESILVAHQGDGKAFLATCFDFLNRKTAFFKDPSVSKTLARLLRDVKQGATSTKPPVAAPSAAATGTAVSSDGSAKVRIWITVQWIKADLDHLKFLSFFQLKQCHYSGRFCISQPISSAGGSTCNRRTHRQQCGQGGRGREGGKQGNK